MVEEEEGTETQSFVEKLKQNGMFIIPLFYFCC